MELMSAGLEGPDAESRPSKQVALLVIAPLRKALASATLLESGVVLILETDFFKQETVICCNSLQSWSVPFCFSTMLEWALEKRFESFPASDIAF